MGRPRTRSLEEAAGLLEDIARRVEAGDRSFELQRPLNDVERVLIRHQHLDGLRLVSRVALLLAHDGRAGSWYEYVARVVEGLAPLDRVRDAAELRELAEDLRPETEGSCVPSSTA